MKNLRSHKGAMLTIFFAEGPPSSVLSHRLILSNYLFLADCLVLSYCLVPTVRPSVIPRFVRPFDRPSGTVQDFDEKLTLS
jgi:hypothetical protein